MEDNYAFARWLKNIHEEVEIVFFKEKFVLARSVSVCREVFGIEFVSARTDQRVLGVPWWSMVKNQSCSTVFYPWWRLRPTCLGATKAMHFNQRAHMLQLLSLHAPIPESVCHNQRSYMMQPRSCELQLRPNASN